MRLTDEMKQMVEHLRLCDVATVTPDGKPNLSPKGKLKVWDGGDSRVCRHCLAAQLTRSPAFPTTLWEGTLFATVCGAVEKPVDIVAVFAL